MRVALAQLNPRVGDLARNADLVVEALRAARAQGATHAASPQEPPTHDGVPCGGSSHACPHAPQLARSASRSTQLAMQQVRSAAWQG